MPRTRALPLLLLPALLAWPRPVRAALGAEPFVDSLNIEALRGIQAQLKEIMRMPQVHTDPLVIPAVGFGDKRAARYRFQRKDEIFYLDDSKRPVSIGWELSDVVETSGGAVERLLSVTGGGSLSAEGRKALAVEQRKAAREGQRLADLLGDDDEKEKLQKKQRSDEEGLEKMVNEFPRALRYKFEDVERGADGEQLFRESFESNDCTHTPHSDPCFTPKSQEARIYEGMKGMIWIRVRDNHLVKFTTTIDHDVKFGYGPVSARAKKGGTISITLSDIDGRGRRWVITDLVDHVTIEKSALASLFTGGSEYDNDNQAMRGFQPVADMSFDQGIELLRKGN